MVVIICNGCGGRIADDDARAARTVQLGPGEYVDWCGQCVHVVRTELPKLAGQAREARRAAAANVEPPEPVQRRALSIWRSGERMSVRDGRPLDST